MTYRLSSDVGGTFTDLVVVDESGAVELHKTLTDYEDHVRGLLTAVNTAASSRGLSTQEFLGTCESFSHGTTVSTNALIEGTSAPVGLMCTMGHRDVLLFREGGREDPFDWDVDYPEPFVLRRLTVGIEERITSDGTVLIPLNEIQVREAVKRFRAQGVAAIAVALLWSFRYPRHELRIAEIIHEEWPEVAVSLSHAVSPLAREYRRTVACAMDASLRPLVGEYLNRLESALESAGFDGSLRVLTSSGGIASPSEVVRTPLLSLDSGPALAPVAGRYYAQRALAAGNVITCDMGGTSFDVSRVAAGDIVITRDFTIGHERLSVPKVDCRTIGAGGGSIAKVDEGGLLRVGPESAKSAPGPACYGRGGDRPTVTDAALLLGYYDAEWFLGGAMKLRPGLAQDAIRRDVAEPLGTQVEEAAFAIWSTVCASMAEAIREITVKVGIDPADYAYVAGGGASGAHIVPIVSELHGQVVVVPRTAGTLSAFGGVVADVVRDFSRSYFLTTEAMPFDEVNRVLADLRQQAEDFLIAAGVDPSHRSFRYSVDARYPFQDRELAVPLATEKFRSAEDVAGLVAAFHDVHEQTLGSRESGDAVECLTWTVSAVGGQPMKNLDGQSGHEDRATTSSGALRSRRPAYFRDLGGYVDTPVYTGAKLPLAAAIEGPAVLEEATTSLVVPPGHVVKVSEHGDYIVEMM